MQNNLLITNIKNNLVPLIITAAFFALWGVLASLLIPIATHVFPWSPIQFINFGFYKEVLLSGIIISSLFTVSVLYYKGGVKRIVSYYLAGIIAYIAIGIFLSLCIVCFWQEIEFNSLPQIIADIEKACRYEEKPIFMISVLTGFSLPSLILIIANKDKFNKDNKVLGDAHFASSLETYKAGFLKREEGAILIGKIYGVPLWANGFEHVLVFAPTGSGKTRSIGIPNLLRYPYSVVCNDVKLTMHKATAKYREEVLGNKCYCWAPTEESGDTHCYNPLDLISKDKRQRITDIQRIAYILIPDNKKSDPIWQQASRKLFKAMVLYLLDTNDKPTTLGEINRLLKQRNFDEWLTEIAEETTHLDQDFYANSYSYLNNHEKTRSSILETLTGYFELFEDKIIDAATSRSDFDIRDLRREKITVYIGFTDDDMERLAPLLTLFWQQLMSVMIRKIPDKKEEPYPLLCLIDEFSSLGRIERLRRSLKLLREYRVRCVLMMQYIAQTYEQYTHDEAKAFTNIKTKIAFAPDDLNDAEYISKLIGNKTIRVSNFSSNTQSQGYSESKGHNFQASPLIRPEEIMQLAANRELILRVGSHPIKSERFQFW